MTPRKGRTRVRRRGAVLRALAVAAAVVPFAAGASAPQERTWNGKHNIEAIRLEDVADEDRPPGVGGTKQGADARADEGEKPDDERREAVEFGAALSRLWDSIPAYSPVNAQSRLTSGFGWRAGPLSGRREFHGGVDLAAAQGTPVVAPAAGFVETSFFDKASGRVLVLEHGNGIETVYGHLDVVLVTAGQQVQRGTLIGRVGTTGWKTTGPHLHYGIRVARKYVDPGRYLFRKK